jgi:hypothetical protein
LADGVKLPVVDPHAAALGARVQLDAGCVAELELVQGDRAHGAVHSASTHGCAGARRLEQQLGVIDRLPPRGGQPPELIAVEPQAATGVAAINHDGAQSLRPQLIATAWTQRHVEYPPIDGLETACRGGPRMVSFAWCHHDYLPKESS